MTLLEFRTHRLRWLLTFSKSVSSALTVSRLPAALFLSCLRVFCAG
jgi:hypothetical protein